MRVVGKFKGGFKDRNIAEGSYAAFDVRWVHVETYTGASIEEDQRCYLKISSGVLIIGIMSKGGEYISPKKANALVKDIAVKDIVDLDEYGMEFYDVFDIIPESIAVRNEFDENFNPIPLEVESV